MTSELVSLSLVCFPLSSASSTQSTGTEHFFQIVHPIKPFPGAFRRELKLHLLVTLTLCVVSPAVLYPTLQHIPTEQSY